MGKKLYLILLLGLLLNCKLLAQVTIGSGFEPVQAALLEIKDQQPNIENITSQTGGIVLPRVKLVSISTLEPFISTGDTQWLNASTSKVKELHAGLMVYNLNIIPPFKQGIYTWDGTIWKYHTTGDDMQVFSSGSGITLNSGKIDLGGDLTTNTTVNLNSKTLGFPNGSVGIGVTSPNASAALEISANNKGFLPPRVALTATNSALPITSPAVGLVVYNTAEASSDDTAVHANNLYTWDGSKWNMLVDKSTFESTLTDAMNNLGVPRSAVFQLNSNISNFLNGVGAGNRQNINMEVVVNNIPDDISYTDIGGDYKITIKKSGIYAMTMVYEATHVAAGCSIASYLFDFPDQGTSTRIHSTAAFSSASYHGGNINCTAIIYAGRTFPIHLGRGQSGNCTNLGCTLMAKSTHFVITKIGELPQSVN